MSSVLTIRTPFDRYDDVPSVVGSEQPKGADPAGSRHATATTVAEIETKAAEAVNLLCQQINFAWIGFMSDADRTGPQSPRGRFLKTPQKDPVLREHKPKTPLGEIVLKLRRLYIQEGGKLLGWDQIEDEVEAIRGGWQEG